MTALASALLLDRTALTRNLEPLIERRWIEVICGEDARRRTVSLTAAGERALRQATPHWQRAQRAVAARVGAKKLEALIDTLHELESLHPALE